MEEKDVKNLPWTKVTDWSELSTSYKSCNNGKEIYFVCETDVDVFVENVYRDISRQLNISYEKLEPILTAENVAFNTLKELLFKECCGYGNKNVRLIQLKNTLRVPDISNIKNIVADNKVSICFKLFEELSDIEKTVFLQMIGKINVKVEHCTVQTEETTVD